MFFAQIFMEISLFSQVFTIFMRLISGGIKPKLSLLFVLAMPPNRMWDLDTTISRPGLAWWWWWWIFFIENPEDPAHCRQLMIASRSL